MTNVTGFDEAESALYRSRPAFIVGCPRSGTTLVKMMLDAHPNISCGPETLFMRHIADLERQHLQLTQFLISEEEWHAHLRDLFLWLHVRRAAQLGKTRWVDKSPSYAVITDFLDTLFPNCQIVHVIRDPRDVIDSWRRRWGLRSAFRATRLWPLHVQRARQFGAAHPDRYFEIRYEKLVRSPEQVMRELVEWLEEPWDHRVLQFNPAPLGGRRPGEKRTRPEERPDGTSDGALNPTKAAATRTPPADEPLGSRVFTSSIGAGRQLSNLPFALLLRISCGPLIRELGYR
ncbi:MAG: sulfotransferase [Acidimicrobiales bacterium]